MCDSLHSHPAVLEPPFDVSVERDPPNATLTIVTWFAPITEVTCTPTAYMIYWTNGDQYNQIIYNGHGKKMTERINTKSEELVYGITVVSLSTDALPSIESSPVAYSET